MTLYTLPTLPLHFVIKDTDGAYWITPATMTGQPRTPYLGPTTTLHPVPPKQARVLLASWQEQEDAR